MIEVYVVSTSRGVTLSIALLENPIAVHGLCSVASMPLVSVIIPVYNAQETIARSVHSILDQTLEDFELIVVNDGSTDGTLQVIEGISDKRMRVVTTSHQGVAHAANAGTKDAASQLIARMDADDFSHPQRLELQLKLLQETGADVVASQIRILTEQGAEATSLSRYQRWINEETSHRSRHSCPAIRRIPNRQSNDSGAT